MTSRQVVRRTNVLLGELVGIYVRPSMRSWICNKHHFDVFRHLSRQFIKVAHVCQAGKFDGGGDLLLGLVGVELNPAVVEPLEESGEALFRDNAFDLLHFHGLRLSIDELALEHLFEIRGLFAEERLGYRVFAVAGLEFDRDEGAVVEVGNAGG